MLGYKCGWGVVVVPADPSGVDRSWVDSLESLESDNSPVLEGAT